MILFWFCFAYIVAGAICYGVLDVLFPDDDVNEMGNGFWAFLWPLVVMVLMIYLGITIAVPILKPVNNVGRAVGRLVRREQLKRGSIARRSDYDDPSLLAIINIDKSR